MFRFGGGGFFASILLRVHGSKTYFFGDILISETDIRARWLVKLFLRYTDIYWPFPIIWVDPLCALGILGRRHGFHKITAIQGSLVAGTSLGCCLCSCLAQTVCGARRHVYCRSTGLPGCLGCCTLTWSSLIVVTLFYRNIHFYKNR